MNIYLYEKKYIYLHGVTSDSCFVLLQGKNETEIITQHKNVRTGNRSHAELSLCVGHKHRPGNEGQTLMCTCHTERLKVKAPAVYLIPCVHQ